MNRSNLRPKRSMGKDSPLSKRPKLDFTSRTKESPNAKKSRVKDSPKSCNGNSSGKNLDKSFGKFEEENPPTASDWDEDFSGDMLEKVCLIADLSQAMVNNESTTAKFDKEKTDFEILESSKDSATSKGPPGESESDCKKLKLEIENLKDKLKTKEGEVHILRSQLKQSEDAKQAVALQNIKVLEELQKKCSEKINASEKELESTKSKLLFRDLEYKTLSERCRQLEYNLSKNKLVEVNAAKPISMSQASIQKPSSKETHTNNQSNNQSSFVDGIEGNMFSFEFPNHCQHEGKCLMKIICPDFFKLMNETSVVPLYKSQNRVDSRSSGVDFGKTEKYKWSNLPEQNIYIKDLYNSVSNLFVYNNFNHKDAKKMVQTIFEDCFEILTYQKKVLLFLVELQCYKEFDEADHFLLENEEEVKSVTIKDLIGGNKLNKEECAIEGRRSLALIYSLIKTSNFAFDLVKNNHNFVELLRDLSAAVGALRRPLRYSGTLIGITLILQKILEHKSLTKELLVMINQTVEELIFARPKLDVLKEVVNVLAAGKHHLDFLMHLCKLEPVDSCTLYMDCKLKQAMFFTKSACPLKLLCMQIMSLACLPSSKTLRWEITNCVINWLNNSMNIPNFRNIKWLPSNSVPMQAARCFNVVECLLYLLTLCLKDYNADHSHQDEDDIGITQKTEFEKRKINCVSVIAQGAVLLKRILKMDSRLLHENSYSLRFAVLLKTFLPSKSELCHKTHMNHITSLQMEAISWITDLIENDFANTDYYLKQNTSMLPDTDVFNALKINSLNIF